MISQDVQALLPILGQTRDVNAVAGLIKLYFREMPEPLIPFNLYTAVIAAAGMNILSFSIPRVRVVVIIFLQEAQEILKIRSSRVSWIYWSPIQD